ncbi:MAG: TIGR03618 family F420-dependent PPOX class oxidoreductase [Ilumatobacteraceae bacterium]|nr:TIGR03618 family F420-dependent PPOX class oxidoreductase [Ilumatobacteraceae bacterium]
MPSRPFDVSPALAAFLAERHLASLTTLRADGSPHVVPVGFSFDAASGEVRVITFDGCQKVANARRGGRAAVSQVDGGRWVTLEGDIRATTDPSEVAAAVAGYASRYQQPKERPDRVALIISVDRVLASKALLANDAG